MQEKLNKLLISKKKSFVSICCKKELPETEILNNIANFLSNGSDIIELNNINYSTANFINLSRKVRELTAQFNSLLVIFDRIDIAKLIEADGITLDKNSISIKDSILLTEKTMLIGYKCIEEVEAISAKNNGADFIITSQTIENIDIHQFKNK